MTKEDNEREDLIVLTEVKSSHKTLFKLLEKIEAGQKEFGTAMIAMDTRVTAIETTISVLKSHASKLWSVVLIIVAALLTGYFTDVFQRNSIHSPTKNDITKDK